MRVYRTTLECILSSERMHRRVRESRLVNCQIIVFLLGFSPFLVCVMRYTKILLLLFSSTEMALRKTNIRSEILISNCSRALCSLNSIFIGCKPINQILSKTDVEFGLHPITSEKLHLECSIFIGYSS